MTVHVLLNSMDSVEYSEWQAYYRIQSEELDKMRKSNEKAEPVAAAQVKTEIKGVQKQLKQRR